jgi:hypothetical protein
MKLRKQAAGSICHLGSRKSPIIRLPSAKLESFDKLFFLITLKYNHSSNSKKKMILDTIEVTIAG